MSTTNIGKKAPKELKIKKLWVIIRVASPR